MEWIIPGFGVMIFIGLLTWRFESKKSDTHGSAGWAKVWTLFKAGLFKKRGLRLGEWKRLIGIYYDGIHLITFGKTGAGKGTTVIQPNLQRQNWIFLVDPGAENTMVAAKGWRQRGLEFRCINVFGMGAEEPWALPAHGFNPLDALDPDSRTLAADAEVIAAMLVPRRGSESGNSSYFKDAATSAISAMLIHIKTSEPKERQTLETLYRYAYATAAEWQALIEAMQANKALGDLVALEANKLERIEAQASEEFSAIMSTIQQTLRWLADPLAREKMSRSDVDFSLLKGLDPKQKGGVISVVLPLEYIESHAAITRLAMACAVLTFQRQPIARNKVLFLIDEAAALGKIERFPNWLATLRKHRVVIWSFWQNVGQLVDLYGRNWQTLVGNCGVVQILGVSDTETADHTQKLLGQCTIKTTSINGRGERSTSEAARPLQFADELRKLADDRQIVFIGNLAAAQFSKVAYFRQPELRGRYYRNAYVSGKFRQPGVLDHLRALQGRLYYGLVWLMAPHPLSACGFTAALAYAGWSLWQWMA